MSPTRRMAKGGVVSNTAVEHMPNPIAMNPIAVEGAWRLGWTLDVHTVSSEFLGYDNAGHAQFDTRRSELGELLYQLKYRGQAAAADQIAGAMSEFLSQKPVLLTRTNLIVPMPPSSSNRTAQPVLQVAERLAARLKTPCDQNAVRKVRETPQLKDIRDPGERREILDGAFEGRKDLLKGRGVLLIDDLYRSGATANAVTLALIAAGAERVFFVAATRTRSSA